MAIAQKPFTALVEDVMLEVRENSSEDVVERKYQRRINDIYVRELPAKEFDFMKASSSITVSGAYFTGTITGSSGSANVTGTSTVWASGHSTWKMKISGNDEIYTFTYSTGTTGTVSPVLTAAVSAATYILFQDSYSLVSDFDRFAIPPGMFYDYAGNRIMIQSTFPKDWYSTWKTTRNIYPTNYRRFGRDSSNLFWQVQVTPPITTSKKLSYEYYPLFTEMTEYTTGTCASAAGDETVTGTGTDFSNNVSAGDAFRLDALPNDWYLVESITDATHLELTATYPSTNSTAAYTICKVPKIPVQLQQALFYGGCLLSSQDQDNAKAVETYSQLYAAAINSYMTIQNRAKYGRQRMGYKDMYR